MTTYEVMITIAIIAFFTFLTRAIPFILFPENKKTPKYILNLGEVLPHAIMGMLIIYCLKNTSFINAPFGIPEILSVGFVVLLHLLKSNTLLSIGGGTIMYMFLVQTVFV